MTIVFATNNRNKVKEVQHDLDGGISLITLQEIGFDGELPEDGDTLQANARQKASVIYDEYGLDCFSDDTGLFIEALDGRPGVYSARYAGPASIAQNNIEKVLRELGDETNRNAVFKTVIHLIIDGEEMTFEGEVRGTIATNVSGVEGFGYDPIFIPEGESRTFAEMTTAEKNEISHRVRAFRKLTDFLCVEVY